MKAAATLQRGRPGASPWTAGLDIDDFAGSARRLVAAAGCSVWSPNYRDVTAASLAEAQALGLKDQRARRHGALDPDGRRGHHHGLSEPPARGDGGEGNPAAASCCGPLKRRPRDPVAAPRRCLTAAPAC